MRGSKDLASVESLTRSGTGGGMGVVKRRRKMERVRKDIRIVRRVEDRVEVRELILQPRKLKNATNGSRCWTSARTANRISIKQSALVTSVEGRGFATIVRAVRRGRRIFESRKGVWRCL